MSTEAKQRANAKQKERYWANRDVLRRKAREHYQRVKDTPEFKASKRNSTLKWRYGISAVDYDRMCEEQANACAICGEAGRLVVNHSYATGEVRALLCQRCNITVGHVETHPDVKAALEYVERYA